MTENLFGSASMTNRTLLRMWSSLVVVVSPLDSLARRLWRRLIISGSTGLKTKYEPSDMGEYLEINLAALSMCS